MSAAEESPGPARRAGRLTRGVRLLAVAGTAAGLAATSGTPLYDGLGFPDQPYRYVGGSPAPSPATVSVVLQGGSSQASYLATREFGPQLSVDLPPGALRATAPQVTVRAAPLAAQGSPPRGSWDSNVYALAVAPAAVRFTGRGSVILRSAVMTKPDPVAIVRLAGQQAWREVPTRLVGNDVLQVQLAGPGEYALERLPGATPIGSSGGRGSGGRGGGFALDTAVWALIGVGFVVLVGSAGVSAVRERRRRRPSG